MAFSRYFGSGPRFTVHIYEDDYEWMKSLVRLHPAKETGGNLFGLWAGDGEPVLHVVLGPAIGCTRTEVSFYQSIPYLERVGGLLTKDYQLCHIGEWHSHHRLRLSEPSSGDSSTVIRNYPRGTCGFLLIIANILQNGQVSLSPYLYKEGQRNYEKGEINKLPGQSPFRLVDVILRHILKDEDKSSTVNEQRPREGYRPSSASSPQPAKEGEQKHDHVYMFEEDQKMIEGLLRERGTGEISDEGDLFGLWTTEDEPVLHVVLKPTERKKNEPPLLVIDDHPPEEKEKGGESLCEEYPFMKNIGKCILHPPEQHEPTKEEASIFTQEYPIGGVLVIAYTVGEEPSLAPYLFSKSSESYQTREMKFLPGPKVFRQEQRRNNHIEIRKQDKDKETPMETDQPPDSPSQQNIGGDWC